MAKKPYVPNRHTTAAFSYEQTERFLAGEWVAFISDWPQQARWDERRQAVEVRFKSGHMETYPADRPTALGFAFAPSKGGFIHDHWLNK